MAVPFSRPQYHSGSGVFLPPMPMRHRRRRPRQHQQQRQDQLQSGASPIEQLLNGDRLDLSGLSFTSRLAFYALYEAWRLLQELTGSRGDHHEAIHQQPTPTEVPIPTSKTHMNVNSCPVETTSATCTPTISSSTRPRADVKPDCARKWTIADGRDDCSSLPDIVPADQGREECSTIKDQMFMIQNEVMDEDEDEEEEEEEEEEEYEDEPDGKLRRETHLLKKCFADQPLSSSWGAVGFQLCQIASAFEVGLCSPSDERQRRIFLAYQDIKLRTLQRDMKVVGDSGGESHFAKSVCRQILLSGIWLLVKRVV